MKKIIHLHMPELYSIERGKAGKSVEFELKGGINHVNGFIVGFLINNGHNASDKRFCRGAAEEHMRVFSVPPEVFGFDRCGHS